MHCVSLVTFMEAQVQFRLAIKNLVANCVVVVRIRDLRSTPICSGSYMLCVHCLFLDF